MTTKDTPHDNGGPAAGKPATSAGAKPGDKRAPVKSARRRAREHALQGIYQWLLTGDELAVIDAHTREQEGFEKSDRNLYDKVFYGAVEDAADLDAVLARHADRKTTELSPIEHAILMIGAFELKHSIDVPYKVAINEAVELAKSFGGTDGHKYVNGVLDRAAADLRPVEVKAARG
ncbi:transcription antitermination factor NusB [Roseateles amylovorans]|uniref:Transcription antitermination protein NusB n=1 Tax=Roseateles amylovorans TaxID=2978473 RepID=A0ABY6B5X1_9BURK|nr:transcription antitermination factor NusB [Roseateles amylovorans]UXH80299.1 transcription antitermination factor NusB [Roseateles amylovorans]